MEDWLFEPLIGPMFSPFSIILGIGLVVLVNYRKIKYIYKNLERR